jgi:hypothetical protein
LAEKFTKKTMNKASKSSSPAPIVDEKHLHANSIFSSFEGYPRETKNIQTAKIDLEILSCGNGQAFICNLGN